MKIPVSWLRDFVDVPGTAEQIGRTMSVRGFAVESIDAVGDDAVIDFEILANRPDCMSVIGMAREIATAYGLPLRELGFGGASLSGSPGGPDRLRQGSGGPPKLPAKAEGSAPPKSRRLVELEPVDRSDIDVVIEDPLLCPRYAGAVADVTMGPSPGWIQRRLHTAGVRPISNIVDITNYVLLELGQPMHAFDLTKIGGAQIRVRTARSGERLRTLDGQMRELSPEMLVIADADRAVAIAGVMGGADSEVTDKSGAIVFESAYFNPLSVRRTSRKLGLKTEASMRFERGVDPNLAGIAMARACALLETIGAGRARGSVIDRYPHRREAGRLRLRRHKITGLLGAAIPDDDVERILTGLGFAVAPAPDGWDVTVPTRRVDALREVDLIEEVARHYGFDRLPVTFPELTAPAPPPDPRIVRARQLRTVLTSAGFSEAVTFGFISEAAAAPFAAASEIVPIANPLSETFAVLRPSVVPGLIAAVAHNRRREQRDVRLFEIGARFSRDGEHRMIACAWTGAATPEHWSAGAREVDFFDIKGVVERVCQTMRIDTATVPHREQWLVPGRSAAVTCNGRRLGVLGQLAPALAEAHGLTGSDAIYVAEFDLDVAEQVAARGDVVVEPLPRYPSVVRDVSILVDDTLTAETVRATVRNAAPATLVRVREFDRYQGKGVPEGRVSLSLRLTFRSAERTLTDAEIQAAMDAIIGALQRAHGAVQR